MKEYYHFSPPSCCLTTPLSLASVGGGKTDLPACGPPASFSVHLANSAITPTGSVHKSSVSNMVCMLVQLKPTLCKYDLRKGDLIVLIWARVRRVRRGSISSVLLMWGGSVSSILLLPLVDRCLYMAHVCFYVCCSDCVGVCG